MRKIKKKSLSDNTTLYIRLYIYLTNSVQKNKLLVVNKQLIY